MPLSDPATLEDGFFDVQACNDSNRCELFVFADERQAVLLARLDTWARAPAARRCSR